MNECVMLDRLGLIFNCRRSSRSAFPGWDEEGAEEAARAVGLQRGSILVEVGLPSLQACIQELVS